LKATLAAVRASSSGADESTCLGSPTVTAKLGTVRRADVDFNIGVVKLKFRRDDLVSLRTGLTRSIYTGSHMITDRDTRIALDAGTDAKSGDHYMPCTAYTGPWHQRQLRAVGVTI
jgi:hypothetical protein